MSTIGERVRAVAVRLYAGLERLEQKPMYWPFTKLAPLLVWGRARLFSLLAPTPEQLAATGGAIGAGETASLLVQRIIRRWVFLGTITAITFYLWVIRDPIWHHSPADSWNYFLSWLAIAIESVVGMFFFGQSLRDGGVIRAILSELTQHVLTAIEHLMSMMRQNLRMERTMIARLDAQDRKLDAIYALLAARTEVTGAVETAEHNGEQG